MDYRGLEGLSRCIADQGVIPKAEDFSTAWARIHNFNPKIKLPSFKDLNIGTDGTGMSPRNGGGYLEFKYGKKRRKKYIMVVVTVDVKHKKLLAVEAHVEGEGLSEPEIGRNQGKEIIEKGYRVVKVNADRRHDTNDTFDFWDNHGPPICAIPIHNNAKIRLSTSEKRKDEIRIWRRLGVKRWYRKKRAGERLVVEGEHSAVKRRFGENLRSRSESALCFEANRKYWAYDLVKDYATERM